MENRQLPERVETLLLPPKQTNSTSNNNERLCCCSYCGCDVIPPRDSKHDVILSCNDCHLPRYCSVNCQHNHSVVHHEKCHAYRKIKNPMIAYRPPEDPVVMFGYLLGWGDLATKVMEGDALVKMGYHCDYATNRHYYFRRALKCYLDGMKHHNAFQNTATTRFGTGAEDRVIMLMVILGGDAQLLLDWLCFTAEQDDDAADDNTDDNPPPSAASEEKIRHPLLALHGLFDKDTNNQNATSLVNLYLLACCRSLAQHRRKKNALLAFQSAILHGMDQGVISPKMEAIILKEEGCNNLIAGYLWDFLAEEYQYGECLTEEIRRTIHHIQQHKRDGTEFLKYACNDTINFSPRLAPALLTNQHSGGAPVLNNNNNHHNVAPVSDIPELWLLYQECLLDLKPDLDLLKDFLDDDDDDDGEKRPRPKTKKD